MNRTLLATTLIASPIAAKTTFSQTDLDSDGDGKIVLMKGRDSSKLKRTLRPCPDLKLQWSNRLGLYDMPRPVIDAVSAISLNYNITSRTTSRAIADDLWSINKAQTNEIVAK